MAVSSLNIQISLLTKVHVADACDRRAICFHLSEHAENENKSGNLTGGPNVEYDLYVTLSSWRFGYNLAIKRTIYENASKVALMLRVENNLNRSGLPCVCIAFLSFCFWSWFRAV